MSYTLAFFTAPIVDLRARLGKEVHGSAPEAVVKRAVAVLRELGRPVDALDHSSTGGEWFRNHFIHEVLGSLIGVETAEYLVERPLAGTVWSGYPSMGWLARDELAKAVAMLDATPVERDDPEDEELLELVSDILHMAVETNQDLITVYS